PMRRSSQRRAMLGRHARLAGAAFAVALAAVLCASLGARAADPSGVARWLDVESRIQYAYYTEERRDLEGIVASLAADTGGAGGRRSYYVALASYRLAELSETGAVDRMKQSVERCVSALGAAEGAPPAAAERLALQSACLRLQATFEPLRSPYLRARSASAMRRALALAPHNPRVLLLHALADRDERRARAQVTRELRQAAAAFEVERQGVERVPEWGAAEAYAFLGRSLLEQGQTLAARGALERALLLVPDFALAHRLMARITAG
ncbi:MAG: hypothetical protein ACREUG_08140, partial [Steroidobacteraceae bacterium]